MTIKAVLFDLDDTLVQDQGGYRAAASAAWSSVVGVEPDVDELMKELRHTSRKLWDESPAREYTMSVGLFPLAGLVSAYPGQSEGLALLREWAPAYRDGVWRKVLGKLGGPKALAVALADEFARRVFVTGLPLDGATSVVQALGQRYRLAVVTNGVADVQQAKLRASGLAVHFATVAISTEVGFGKPDGRIFKHALDALGVQPAEAVIVGDNRVNDIDGGLDAGMRAVWLQPNREKWAEAPATASVVESLSAVPSLLARMTP